jgi:hypothetical protein
MGQKQQRGWVIDDETIKDAETPTRFSGAYEVKILEAVTGFYLSGAEYVKLRVEIPENKDENGKPKQYPMEKQVITAGDTKGNAPTFYMGIFQSAFKILGVSNKVGKAEALVWDRDERAFVPDKVDQYVELLGKKIGAVIKMTREFPIVTIDGYTKDILHVEDIKECPYAVRIPAYRNATGESNRTYARFSIERFFSVNKENGTYGKTATEIMEGKPAKDIAKLCEYLKQQDTEADIMDDTQMNEYILAQLKKILNKNNEEFDEIAWVTYGSAVEDSDVPFAN